MRKRLFPQALSLSAIAPHAVPVAVGLILVAALSAGLNLLEQISIVYMDAWIPLQSMEEAEFYTLVLSASAQAVQIALVGLAVLVIARPLVRSVSARFSAIRFLGFWFMVSVIIGVATLALDGLGYWLQFSGLAMDGTTFRWAFLALIYAKLLAYFVLFWCLFGAGAFASAPENGVVAAASATRLPTSAAGFFLFLVVWLSIDGVLIPLVSYLPFVSPFWFVPNEDEPSRYLVGQGARIAAEAVAFVLYALLWVRLFGRSLTGQTAGQSA